MFEIQCLIYSGQVMVISRLLPRNNITVQMVMTVELRSAKRIWDSSKSTQMEITSITDTALSKQNHTRRSWCLIILEKKMRHPNTTHILTEASMKLAPPPLIYSNRHFIVSWCAVPKKDCSILKFCILILLHNMDLISWLFVMQYDTTSIGH